MRGAASHAPLRQPSAVKLEGRAVHIVTASDENYVVGVMVLIASVARHNPQARFTVLTTEWSPASHAKLQQLRQRLVCKSSVSRFLNKACAACQSAVRI